MSTEVHPRHAGYVHGHQIQREHDNSNACSLLVGWDFPKCVYRCCFCWGAGCLELIHYKGFYGRASCSLHSPCRRLPMNFSVGGAYAEMPMRANGKRQRLVLLLLSCTNPTQISCVSVSTYSLRKPTPSHQYQVNSLRSNEGVHSSSFHHLTQRNATLLTSAAQRLPKEQAPIGHQICGIYAQYGHQIHCS